MSTDQDTSNAGAPARAQTADGATGEKGPPRRRRRSRRGGRGGEPAQQRQPEAAGEQAKPPAEGEKRRRRRRRRRPPKAAEAAGSTATGPPSADRERRPSTLLAFPAEDDWDISEIASPAASQPPAGAAGREQPAREGRGKRPPRRRRRRSSRQATADDQQPVAALGKSVAARGATDAATEAEPDRPPKREGPSPFEIVSPARDPDHEDLVDLVASEEALLDGALCNVVRVQFGAARAVNDFDAGDLQVQAGAQVLVDSQRGPVVGTATTRSMRQMMRRTPPRVVSFLRSRDYGYAERNASREQQAYELCRAQVEKRKLPMKLARVEYLHNGSKALFYFSANSRVDFRDLVRDLARKLRARIEMRQVGVRDESKVTGARGPCGRELCCSSWINEFQPVSIRMAKDQGLVLNPAKVSGMCGRLKCCLAYEQRLYHEARKQLPKVGQQVRTPQGEGRCHELDIPRKLVRVVASDGTTATYPAAEIEFTPRGQQQKGKQPSERGTPTK